jgi:hypothetical protein
MLDRLLGAGSHVFQRPHGYSATRLECRVMKHVKTSCGDKRLLILFRCNALPFYWDRSDRTIRWCSRHDGSAPNGNSFDQKIRVWRWKQKEKVRCMANGGNVARGWVYNTILPYVPLHLFIHFHMISIRSRRRPHLKF